MISIDFTNMMDGAVQNGVTEAEWSSAAAQFPAVYNGVKQLNAAGTIGFQGLPSDNVLIEQVTEFAEEVKGKYDDVVLLGIGGSALGPIALKTALCKTAWNTLAKDERNGYPRLHVLDNIDPVTIDSVMRHVDLKRTLFIVTSKSGGTAETMSQFLVAHDRIQAAKLNVSDHFVFVTDPEQGALRPLAAQLNVRALDIPPNVGGRYSVLTPVGTLPAALLGIDIRALLQGAGDMAKRCDTTDLAKNPAGIFGTLNFLSDTKHGRVINVLMPYSDPLRDFAAWYVQLWAESLGKHRADGTSVGSTPLPALGATDQHSQVQLFMEGPANKTIAFIAVQTHETDLTIPHAFPNVTELSYLGGHSFAELINIEQRASAGALAKRGRANMTIHIDQVDPWHIGGLMMMLEIGTAFAGQLYQVDAFNQPGVELGKQFAYALLGRPGADSAKTEWENLPKPDARWRVAD